MGPLQEPCLTVCSDPVSWRQNLKLGPEPDRAGLRPTPILTCAQRELSFDGHISTELRIGSFLLLFWGKKETRASKVRGESRTPTT